MLIKKKKIVKYKREKSTKINYKGARKNQIGAFLRDAMEEPFLVSQRAFQ